MTRVFVALRIAVNDERRVIGSSALPYPIDNPTPAPPQRRQRALPAPAEASTVQNEQRLRNESRASAAYDRAK